MTELPDLSATDLLAGYAAKALSPVDVTRAVLDRIEAWEPKLNAMWAMDAEAAMDAARASESRWHKGEATGALDGVPITIKENIATKGVAMPLGSAATELVPYEQDAPAAARVRAAGAVILGKTTMPDMGMLSSGLSSFHKLARNPWDLSTNPGGSSAGAGTAAAAGYGPLHLGTDIGGSVRLPAGWCGVVGLKPSFGRIPVSPPFPGRVIGPMTRSVTDNALLMQVLSGPDLRDTMSLPDAAIDWTDLKRDLRGLRLGLMMDPGIGLPAMPQVRAAVEAAAKLFEAAGAIIEPMDGFLKPSMLDGLDKFWRARSWTDLSALSPERLAKVLPYIRTWAEGAKDLTGMEVFNGFMQMGEMRSAALAACGRYDYVLSPVAPMPAYPAELPGPTNDPQRPFEHIGFTVAFNMSDQPAISVDCGATDTGLPIGLQIAGPRFDDLGVLQMAHAFETLRGRQRPWPRP